MRERINLRRDSGDVVLDQPGTSTGDANAIISPLRRDLGSFLERRPSRSLSRHDIVC